MLFIPVLYCMYNSTDRKSALVLIRLSLVPIVGTTSASKKNVFLYLTLHLQILMTTSVSRNLKVQEERRLTYL